MRLDTGEPQEGTFNLTPLIDVVFLLLVFFLAATTFNKDEDQLDLTLPEAQSGHASKDTRQLVINVASDGRITVDGREVNREALLQKLAAAAARDKDQEVLIRGDKSAMHGMMMQVFDACRLHKLTRISLGALPLVQGQ
jgi:biopolymer transport protein ExbD